MEAEAEVEAANFSKPEAEAEAEAMKKLPLPDTLVPSFKLINTLVFRLYHLLQIMLFYSNIQQPDVF